MDQSRPVVDPTFRQISQGTEPGCGYNPSACDLVGEVFCTLGEQCVVSASGQSWGFSELKNTLGSGDVQVPVNLQVAYPIYTPRNLLVLYRSFISLTQISHILPHSPTNLQLPAPGCFFPKNTTTDKKSAAVFQLRPFQPLAHWIQWRIPAFPLAISPWNSPDFLCQLPSKSASNGTSSRSEWHFLAQLQWPQSHPEPRKILRTGSVARRCRTGS